MCYPLPGPRCASHLSGDIEKATQELQTYQAALDKNANDKIAQQHWTNTYNKLNDLGMQYDGTKTGQQKLDDLITHAPNRKTQDYLINRKLVAKDLYDGKKRALVVQQEGAHVLDRENRSLYLQGKDAELVKNLMRNAPLDPKETPASRRQAERNALLNFKARMAPYKTVTEHMGGKPTVRDNVTPDGYFVVSGKSTYGSGQTHYVFKGDPKDTKTAELVGHVQVSLNHDFSVRAKGYRGNGVIGGESVSAQTSHMDYFKAVIDPNYASDTQRDRFDFDDIRRVDWGEWADSKPGARV